MNIIKLYTGLLFIVFLFAAGCATSPDRKIDNQGTTVAVWNLENLSPLQSIDRSFDLSDMGDILSNAIVEAINSSKEYDVIERENLLLALEELGLGSSALADETTKLKIGKIIGARLMIFGGYIIIEDTVRFDIRLVDVESGAVVKSAQKVVKTTNITEILNAVTLTANELL